MLVTNRFVWDGIIQKITFHIIHMLSWFESARRRDVDVAMSPNHFLKINRYTSNFIIKGMNR